MSSLLTHKSDLLLNDKELWINSIDLIFTNQPNLIIESGVQATLSNTCHHQIIYAKISFKIYYSPSYKREVWHYNDAQINSIQSSISNFDWKKAFENLSVNEQVEPLFHRRMRHKIRDQFSQKLSGGEICEREKNGPHCLILG